jgi:hypothetical protein
MTLTDDQKKALGDWEKIKPLVLMPGWNAIQEYLQRESSDLMKRSIFAMDDLLLSDTAEHRESYKALRIEYLGAQRALNVYALIEQEAKQIQLDMEDEKILEGVKTPGD